MDNGLITLKQAPVISHRLKEIGASVTKRIDELNIENQLATDETIKFLKSLRAELRKEATEFEDQRKFIKDAVMNPYNEFESVYKDEIIAKYKNADELLKTKINDFEMSVKALTKKNLETYFKEIVEMEQIDWLTFDRLGIEINLSTSEKKYKEQILATISGIIEDLDLIKTEEFSAEMLVEYKKTLKASQAIQDVRARRAAEKQEQVRIKMERTDKRAAQLRSLNFIYHDVSRTYNCVTDESVMIAYAEIENLSNDEWIVKFAELELKASPKEEKKEILQAPKIEAAQPIEAPKIFTATFEVTGTYEQLKSLGEFLKSNNYNYKNI